jgi:hypothetical protein
MNSHDVAKCVSQCFECRSALPAINGRHRSPPAGRILSVMTGFIAKTGDVFPSGFRDRFGAILEGERICQIRFRRICGGHLTFALHWFIT